MALITKQVKVSNRVESYLAEKLGVDKSEFKRVKLVNPFIFRFVFFLFNGGEMVGTVNYFWDIRKIQQRIFLKRFKDGKIARLGHLNNSDAKNFFAENI